MVEKEANSGLAIASLICSLLFFIPIAPVIAVVLGIIALAQINKDPKLGGKAMAIAGIIIGGFLTLVLIPLMLIGFLAYFGVFSVG